MNSEALRWLNFAETDLNVAKHLNNTFYPKPLEIICYHCQQAAEKAIKSVIILHGEPGGMPKKHDLSYLLDQIKNTENISDELYDKADVLTPYGIAVRYPSELQLEEHHAADAIRYSEAFLNWAADCLNRSVQ